MIVSSRKNKQIDSGSANVLSIVLIICHFQKYVCSWQALFKNFIGKT
jgi:hypothetical protein